ncbi:MAG: hypothetical protein Q4F95_07265 [Oscillospiraceae bacterium]|nr:hypothetical protein [Oscillospiraceae bacterium]
MKSSRGVRKLAYIMLVILTVAMWALAMLHTFDLIELTMTKIAALFTAALLCISLTDRR